MEEALRSYGIGYRVLGGKTYYARPEVSAVISGLRAIENPNDSLSLAEWLASDLVGYSDEALLHYVLTCPEKRLSYLTSAVFEEGSEDSSQSRLRTHLKALKSLHEERNQIGCFMTSKLLFDLVSAFPSVSLLRRGSIAAFNLQKILDAARISDQHKITFGDFVREWADALEEEREEADYAVTEETEDVVRLLTIHKAKGLDWPVVIIPDLDAEFKASSPVVLFDRLDSKKCAVSLKHSSQRAENSIETETYAELLEQENKFLRAERIRLLYVAMTRARDHLVLPIFSKPLRKTDSFLKYFIEAGCFDEGFQTKPEFTALFETEVIDIDVLHDASKPTWQTPAAAESFVITSEDKESMNIAVEDCQKGMTVPQGEVIVFSSPSLHSGEYPFRTGHPDGFLLGEAFHKLMETLNLEDSSNWYKSVKAVSVDLGLDVSQQALLKTWLSNFSGLPSFKEIIGKHRWTEVPFTWTRKKNIDGSIEHFDGRIDLLAETDDGLLIVDYKTDLVPENGLQTLLQYYRPQGEVYQAAIRELVPDASRVRMRFCFVDANVEQDI